MCTGEQISAIVRSRSVARDVRNHAKTLFHCICRTHWRHARHQRRWRQLLLRRIVFSSIYSMLVMGLWGAVVPVHKGMYNINSIIRWGWFLNGTRLRSLPVAGVIVNSPKLAYRPGQYLIDRSFIDRGLDSKYPQIRSLKSGARTPLRVCADVGIS